MDLPRRAASSARQRQPLPFCRRTYLPPSPRCGRRWHSRPQDADVSSFPNSLASFPVWSFGFLNTFSLDRISLHQNHHTCPLFPQRPASGIAMPLGRQICGTSPHTDLALSLAGPQSDIGWVVIDGPFCFCFCPVCPAQTARHPPPRLQTIFSRHGQNSYSLSDSMCVSSRASFPGRNHADDESLRPRLDGMCMARTVVS